MRAPGRVGRPQRRNVRHPGCGTEPYRALSNREGRRATGLGHVSRLMADLLSRMREISVPGVQFLVSASYTPSL